MQREHISIPKLIAYVLFSVIIFALQTGTFGADMKVELVNDGPGRSAARTRHGSRAARRSGGGGCCRLDGRHLL